MAKTAKAPKQPSAAPAAGPGRDLDQKYRPRVLEDVAGQQAAIKAIRNWKHVPRCVLLYGGPGCGKTTIARILAGELGIRGRDLKEVNCGGIESLIAFVRGLDQEMRMTPMQGERLGWILDEAQVMSRTKGAQEGLLKVLEDCPDHVHFFLCTTEPKRLLEPVRTRCTPVEVKPLPDSALADLIAGIAAAEGLELDPDVAEGIVAAAGGSARVAVKTLELVAGLPLEEAQAVLGGGVGETSEAFALARALLYDRNRTWAGIATILGKLEDQDPETLRQIVMACARKELLKGGANATWAYRVIVGLEKPLHDRNTGRALLAAYLYEIFHAKG